MDRRHGRHTGSPSGAGVHDVDVVAMGVHDVRPEPAAQIRDRGPLPDVGARVDPERNRLYTSLLEGRQERVPVRPAGEDGDNPHAEPGSVPADRERMHDALRTAHDPGSDDVQHGQSFWRCHTFGWNKLRA